MFVEFTCQCGHDFRTHPQNAGKSIVCPNCLIQVQVPDQEELLRRREDSGLDQTQELPAEIPNRFPRRDESVRSSSVARSAESSRKLVPNPAKPNPAAGPTPKTSRHKKPKQGDDEELFDLKNLGPIEAPESELSLPELPQTRRKKSKQDDHQAEPKLGSKKGKNKKPKRDSDSNVPLIIGGIVAGTLVMGAIGYMVIPIIIAAAKQGGKIELPQEFERYEDNEIFFRCEYPKNWEADSRGGSGNIPPSVRIEHGRVKISYRASNSGAAIQDMAQAGANLAGEVPDELKPVARVHDFQREKFFNEMQNYTEVGPVEKIETGWGEGRVSTFTSSGSYGGKIYGYRVTLLTTMFQWNVVCQCSSKREFEAYRPIFRRVIESTGR